MHTYVHKFNWIICFNETRVHTVKRSIRRFSSPSKVACTSGPFFEKNMKRYPIFSLQMNYYQIDKKE